MSLTKDDLQAIQKLLDGSVDTAIRASEDRLIARIDDLDDTLSLQTEHGLQEVRDQLKRVEDQVSDVKTVVNRIDSAQQAELERNDRQDQAIHHMRKQLHAT